MLREAFPHISKSVTAHPSVKITGDVYLGDFCILAEGVQVIATRGRLIIGNHTEIGQNSIISASHDRVVIGDRVKIGTDCEIKGYVGDDSVLGDAVVLTEGTKIGSQCSIASGLEIKEDIPNGVILAQN